MADIKSTPSAELNEHGEPAQATSEKGKTILRHRKLQLSRYRILLIGLITVLATGLTTTLAQSRRQRAAKEFMRDKLELSQHALEGVVTENYELIIAKGTKLSAMTKEADWRLFENPDYELQSQTFRRHVDSLVKAAKDKNPDAATLAYVRVTMSCVDCHKLVRGKLVASAR